MTRVFGFIVLVLGISLNVPAQGQKQLPTASALPDTTLYVSCDPNQQAKQVRSPVSWSQDSTWRAYITVDVRNCLYTTQLRVGRRDGQDRLVYLMGPKRTESANGMEILGWYPHSALLLARTDEWQIGSDAPDVQRVLGIEAKTGLVYEPNLAEMLSEYEGKRCSFRVTDAGFNGSNPNIDILVRAKYFTSVNEGDSETDVPVAERCGTEEETWSFEYSNGIVQRVSNAQPLTLFKNVQTK